MLGVNTIFGGGYGKEGFVLRRVIDYEDDETIYYGTIFFVYYVV